MQVYPIHIEDKLEVGKVRQILKDYCSTEAAALKFEKARPLSDFDQLVTFLNQTRECVLILRQTDKPILQFEDAISIISQVKTDGTFLTGEELQLLKGAIQATYSWSQFLKKHKDTYPELFKLILGFISSMDLAQEIEATIDDRGIVRSKATPELSEIRSGIQKAESRVRNAIKKVLEKAKKENYSEPTSEITIREGRLVIPVWAEHKRHISGFIHDESSTGQTVFMEPSEVLEMNNRVRELLYQEKREVQRILVRLSDKIRDQMVDLEKGRAFLIMMDFICAKARFAIEHQGSVPQVAPSPFIRLVNGYHPLLKKLNDQQQKETIPLNLQLDGKGHRICVISGPNAGGKSVAMKTVGLLQYMVQCGFPVTADESSQFGLYQQIFVDIGDSQSLENDLSTYSSRLTAMDYFVRHADKKTLILIDEFGTGTEPHFGGAIAEATLAELAGKGSFGVITTHYANIKKFAERTKGLVNGAMRYDTENLEPLYQLEVGKPGSSFALEIARKIGLSSSLLSKAKELIGDDHVNYDRLLTELESDKSRLERKQNDLNQKEKDVLKIRKDYEAIRDMLESERKKILKAAKEEARQIVGEANRKIETAIREIKEFKADKSVTKRVREDIEQLKKGLKDSTPTLRKSSKDSTVIHIGDRVRIDGQEGTGEVLELKKEQAFVTFGLMKSYIDISRLEKVSGKQEVNAVQNKSRKIGVDEKVRDFRTELDVRGKRAEEVISLVDKFIDDALVIGTNEVRILHGKGYGVLREVVRNHLREDPHVTGIEDEHEDRGGSGVTLVQLK